MVSVYAPNFIVNSLLPPRKIFFVSYCCGLCDGAFLGTRQRGRKGVTRKYIQRYIMHGKRGSRRTAVLCTWLAPAWFMRHVQDEHSGYFANAKTFFSMERRAYSAPCARVTPSIVLVFMRDSVSLCFRNIKRTGTLVSQETLMYVLTYL